MRSILFVFSICFLLSSCKKEVFLINEEVYIGHKSSILIETYDAGQIDMEYTQLMEEARCPHTADCLWPGYVKVKLKLDKNESVELGLGESLVDSVVYNNYVIKLLGVEYDSTSDFGDEKKSSVLIRVD